MPESNGAKLKSFVCVYLVLRRGNDFLLSLRQNTKFENGKWSMVAGHVEEGESAMYAMAREASEEANILIDPSDLEPVYVMDRKTSTRQNIDIFFNCSNYTGKIKNNEPHKCGGIQFFNKTKLPENTVLYIRKAIEDICNNRIFGMFGY